MARSLTASLGTLSSRRLAWFKRTLWTNDIRQRVTVRTVKSSSLPDVLSLKHSESPQFHSQQQQQQQQEPMGKVDCRVGKTVVEIERRFRFDADTESKLTAAGASLVSEKSFVDTYVGRVMLCWF